MHAVFIVPRFYPCPGGYEQYIFWLAQHLRERGDEVTVITTTAYELESFWLPKCQQLRSGTEDLQGIQVVRLPISYTRWRRRAGRVLGLVPNWRLQARFARPSFAVPGLSAELRRPRCIDVIHVGPLPYNRLMYESLREGRRRGTRVITTPCTHFGTDQGQEVARHYTRPFQIALLNQCDAVLALTGVERQRLIECGVSAQKIWTTGAGIDVSEVTGGDPAEFCAAHGVDGPLVVQIGTKAFDKGTMTVLEAMQRLWAAGSNAWLVLAGTSTSAFDQYLSSHQRDCHRLLNLGAISAAAKRNLLSATTVLAHPSRVESLGLVYLEAWANCKPVIAADTAVTREVVANGSDGILVPFGDVEVLAAVIGRLLADATLRLAMGNAGKMKVQKHFTWNAAAHRIYPFFRKQDMEVTAERYA